MWLKNRALRKDKDKDKGLKLKDKGLKLKDEGLKLKDEGWMKDKWLIFGLL